MPALGKAHRLPGRFVNPDRRAGVPASRLASARQT